ncbi:MAG TPA: extracellular solute-binding protein [Paenibacillus sp.]|nr:extracellular solute-binding protein [Paenibacillus sp.]
MAKPDRETFQSRSNALLTTLRQRILGGTYKPGEFIPSETALADQFQLSKNSVRAILSALVEEGLLVKLPRVGNQVIGRGAQTTIRFGMYPSLYKEARMGELIERFHQAFPHIRVEPLTLPYYHPETVKRLLQLGVVDAITLNYTDYLYFRDAGDSALMEPFPAQPDVYPHLNELFSNGAGGLLVRPFVFSPVVLCYNKEHFREKRVLEPDSGWTWDRLRDALVRLAEPGRCGLFFHLSSNNRWPIFLLQHGVRFSRGADGRLDAPGGRAKAALRRLRDLIDEKGLFPVVMSFGLHDVEQLFKQRKVSAILTTYYRLNELADADFPFDIAQLPKADNAATLLLSTGIAVGAAAPNKEAASCFADFLLSEESQAFVRRTTFTLPANKWVAETVPTEAPNKPQRLELHREMIPQYETHDALGLSVREVQLFGSCLEQYFSKLVDEDELIRLFNEQLQASPGGPPAFPVLPV